MEKRNRALASLVTAIFLIYGSSPTCPAMQTDEQVPSTEKPVTQTPPESVVNDFHPTKFLRLQTDEYNNPVALQTATASYVLTDDKGDVVLEVFLESAIHIADSSYYRSFQKRFERYDTVLYESILKPAEHHPDEAEPPSGLQMLQQLSTGTLGLAYRFDEVDYGADQMVNADLSPQEISARMADRGETPTTLLADLLGHIVQKLNAARSDSQTEVAGEANAETKTETIGFDLSIFTDPDGIMKIRRLMATALVDSKLLESTLPPGIHNMIIGDRNDRAMEVLESEKNKDKRRIAIFFGVGHMADFEKRLVEDYGMKLVNVNWRNAWDLRDGAVEGAPLEGLIESTFRDSFKNKLRQFAKGVTDKKQKEKEAERDQAIVEKDQKIEAMENALKALEAKLNALENQSKDNQDSKKSEPDKAKPDKTDENDKN